MINTRCPNCNSGNTQAAGMIIASGSRHSRGAGLGISSRGSVGYGLYAGSSQSRLAAMLDPGPIPSYLGPVLAIPVVPMLLFVVIASSGGTSAVGLFVLAAAWFLLGAPLYFLRT